MRKIDLLGKRFGRLLVVEELAFRSHACVIWKCLCDCGNIKILSGRYLNRGNSKSCGCYRKVFLRPNAMPAGHSLLNRNFNDYKRGAKSRGRQFDLSFDTFKSIVLSPCHYCGTIGSKRIHRDRQELYCNGIDRKDNNLGYIENNVVPCCTSCNFFKSTLPYEEFISKVMNIANHMKDKI